MLVSKKVQGRRNQAQKKPTRREVIEQKVDKTQTKIYQFNKGAGCSMPLCSQAQKFLKL